MAKREVEKPKDCCLICGSSVHGPPRGSRGLCDRHYRRFWRKYQAFLQGDHPSQAKADAFEAKCIEQGQLLPKRPGGKPKDPDPFDKIVREVEEEFRLVKKSIDEAAELTSKAAKRKRKGG